MRSSILAFIAGLSVSFSASALPQFRTVISGALYTSGSDQRMAQLSNHALHELCEQGFTRVFFVYKGASEKVVNCDRGSLVYSSNTKWAKPSGILSEALDYIQEGGKVLVHCWNGVHASNFVGTAALRQWCGKSDDFVVDWFNAYAKPKTLEESKLRKMRNDLVSMPQNDIGIGGCP